MPALWEAVEMTQAWIKGKMQVRAHSKLFTFEIEGKLQTMGPKEARGLALWLSQQAEAMDGD